MRLLLALLLAPVALAAEVAGYVYLPDGNVVEGAIVRAGNASTRTDKDGGFVLRSLPEGVIELDVDGKAKTLAIAGDVVTITLLETAERPSPLPSPRVATRGEATVSGKVTLDGTPLANAPLAVGEMRVTTNAKGEYLATGLTANEHAVTIDERLAARVRWPRPDRHIADASASRKTVIDLELRSAPMIRGRVIDAEGEPVVHARVHLAVANRPDFSHEASPARTRPDGRYAVHVPDWLGSEQLTVAVTPRLHSTVRSKPFELGDTDRTVDITLPKTETVRIRVLDRAGKPVAGARVAFASTADTTTLESPTLLVQHGLEQRATRTNAEGELVVQLAADTYDFAAVAEDFQSGAVTKAITKPATVDLTLERAALLRGRVHRGDRGVANVNVNILGGRSRGAHVATDAEGKFEINGLAPGGYRITFFKQEELIDRTMDVEAPGDIDLELPPTGTLRGRVIDAATGESIREFVYSIEAPRGGRSGIHRGETTADGAFTVEIPAGAYRVIAAAQNFTASEPVEVRVVENETTAVDLPLGRGATVMGRVTDDDGVPVAGANVMVISADFERMRRAARAGPSQTRTAEDGTFTATGIMPGDAQLTVRKEGYVVYRKTIEAEGTLSLDVTVTRGLSIQGIVTRGGKPVAGAQVGAASAAVGGEHQSATTDDDGRFTLSGLIAARYTVSAFHEELHTELRDVDPTRQKEIRLSLDPKPRGVLYGIVTGIPAMPGKIVRRVVMVYSEDGGAEGMIDEAGNFRIEDAPAGTVSVSAVVESSTRASRSSMRKEVEVLPGQPTRVDLDLGGNVRVSGRITIDGRPTTAYVGFSSEEGTNASTQTGDDGLYEVVLPAPGRYQIYARAEQLMERNFHTVREIRGGETIDIDLREQVIEGTVVDAATRQPIAGALVNVAPAASGLTMIVAEVPTDANGRFRIVTAAAGPLRLIASAHGYAQRAVAVNSTTMQYAIELSPAQETRIRVLDARTNAPLDAHIVFSDDTGILPVRPRRTAEGTTYVFSLAPGKYRVLVVVQGYEPKNAEVTAPGGADIVME